MRVSDEELKWLIEQAEKNCCLLISNIGNAFLDLRDLREAAREAIEAFSGAIPGVDPGIMYEAWWKRMNEAIGKLREATRIIK